MIWWTTNICIFVRKLTRFVKQNQKQKALARYQFRCPIHCGMRYDCNLCMARAYDRSVAHWLDMLTASSLLMLAWSMYHCTFYERVESYWSKMLNLLSWTPWTELELVLTRSKYLYQCSCSRPLVTGQQLLIFRRILDRVTQQYEVADLPWRMWQFWTWSFSFIFVQMNENEDLSLIHDVNQRRESTDMNIL